MDHSMMEKAANRLDAIKAERGEAYAAVLIMALTVDDAAAALRGDRSVNARCVADTLNMELANLIHASGHDHASLVAHSKEFVAMREQYLNGEDAA